MTAANDNGKSPALLTIEEVAVILGCCKRTVERYFASGQLRYLAIGHGRVRLRKRIQPRDLQELIDSLGRFRLAMSVYKPRKSPLYHFDCQTGGVRFHGSTGCTSKRDAEVFERDGAATSPN